jgi:hypothetical protein
MCMRSKRSKCMRMRSKSSKYMRMRSKSSKYMHMRSKYKYKYIINFYIFIFSLGMFS